MEPLASTTDYDADADADVLGFLRDSGNGAASLAASSSSSASPSFTSRISSPQSSRASSSSSSSMTERPHSRFFVDSFSLPSPPPSPSIDDSFASVAILGDDRQQQQLQQQEDPSIAALDHSYSQLLARPSQPSPQRSRSDASETDDVAASALPPPLVLRLAPPPPPPPAPSTASSPQSTSSLSASRVSSVGAADRLDFTGVFRGSSSLIRSHGEGTATSSSADASSATTPVLPVTPQVETESPRSRASSESRLPSLRQTQSAASDISDSDSEWLAARPTRARTTVIRCVDDVEICRVESPGSRPPQPKIIDLRALRTPAPAPAPVLAPATPRRTLEDTPLSQTDLATQPVSSHLLAMSPVVHPGRDADTTRPGSALPQLSLCASPALSVSIFAASSSNVDVHGATTPAKPPALTSSALKQSTVGLGDSTQRPTLAGRVQDLSVSLASTLRRFLHAHRHQSNNADGVTSPQSECGPPPQPPRGLDDRDFYRVGASWSPLTASTCVPGRETPALGSPNAWRRHWKVLAVSTLLGLVLGAILVAAVSAHSAVFNLSAEQVRERQQTSSELVLGAASRWLALPGQLFLRVWGGATHWLLFCYVATALGDLVGFGDRATLVLRLRSLCPALLLTLLAVGEGLAAMWLAHTLGWFHSGGSGSSSAATALSDALGVTPLPRGAVGLQCSSNDQYLQVVSAGVFVCSNTSLTLPLYQSVSTNSSDVTGSGAAVFALQEVTSRLAAPRATAAYYPAALGSTKDVALLLLSAFVPKDLASQFTQSLEQPGAATSLSGLVALALLLGCVCGQRACWLRRNLRTEVDASRQDESAASTAEDSDAVETPQRRPHYILAALVELQLALEWLFQQLQRVAAPFFLSLALGMLVAHHREWHSWTATLTPILLATLLVVTLHAVVALPLVLVATSKRRREAMERVVPLATAFLPTFLVAFVTNSVALAAPVTMQCHLRTASVTRSASQLSTGVTAAVLRGPRALLLPLLLLWLLETSTSETLELSAGAYGGAGLLAFLSCWGGGSGGRTGLALVHTLWFAFVGSQTTTTALPPTLPLLLAYESLLSRVVSAVTVWEHVVLTQIWAWHWDETVVPRRPEDDEETGVAAHARHTGFRHGEPVRVLSNRRRQTYVSQ